MKRPLLLLFLLACLLMLPGIGVGDIASSHEGRVAQTARQMAQSGWPWNARPVAVDAVAWQTIEGHKRLGVDPTQPKLRVNPWLVPVMSGNIRLQKPPLPYWVTAVCFRLFGETAFAARLVPTLLAALLAVIVADLARRLIDPEMGLAAGLIWLGTWFCVEQFRKSMADPYLAFFAIAAVWAWVRGNDEPGTTNDERKAAFLVPRSSFLVLFYVLVGVGFLAKGPAVFVGAIAGVIALVVSHRRFARPLWPHGVGFLLLLAVALPWYIAVKVQVPNAVDLWKYESVGGFGEKSEKPQPFWHYLPMLLTMSLPWTPAWVAGIVLAVRRRMTDRRWLLPLLWQGLIVLVFSVITQKKMAYLMPALAAQTLLAAQGAWWWLGGETGEKRLQRRRQLTTAALIAAVVVAVGLTASDLRDNRRSPRPVTEAARALLPASGASIETGMLSPDVAFYLPLDADTPPGGALRWTILNVGRYGEEAVRREVHGYFARRGVESIRRVPLDGQAGTSTWGLFEVRLVTAATSPASRAMPWSDPR